MEAQQVGQDIVMEYQLYKKENRYGIISQEIKDTALKFIETKYPNYATNSIQGNYYGIEFTYVDLNGNIQTKAKNRGELVPTGQTTAVNNIYDMGGNGREWTTEPCSYTTAPKTYRGGAAGELPNSYPAGYRHAVHPTYVHLLITFRTALFVRL